MSKQHIEVEGGELAIRNSHGDIAIVPKYDRDKVQKMIDAGCDTCIDRYVAKLPRLTDYAADGSLYPDTKDAPDTPPNKKRNKIVVFAESPTRQYNILYLLDDLNSVSFDNSYFNDLNISDSNKNAINELLARRDEMKTTNDNYWHIVKKYDDIYNNIDNFANNNNLYQLEILNDFQFLSNPNDYDIKQAKNTVAKMEKSDIKDKVIDYINQVESNLPKLKTLYNESSNLFDKLNQYGSDINYVNDNLSPDEYNEFFKPVEDKAFQYEANRLKKHYRGNEEIEVVPLYDDIDKFDSIVKSLSEQDKVIIMGHRGNSLMGIENTDLAQSLKHCKATDLYIGSCGFENHYQEFIPSGMNIKYRPYSSWRGVNPTGKNLDEIMFGNLDEVISNQLVEGEHYNSYNPKSKIKKDDTSTDNLQPTIGPHIQNNEVDNIEFYNAELNRIRNNNL